MAKERTIRAASVFAAAFLCLSPAASGQEPQADPVYRRGTTYEESILPPSPEAASKVRHTDIPVSHSQGLATLDIPLHTIRGRELSIPITLSYSTGGIRLDETAGVAGLGWTLNAGGCVTRTVVDMPDELSSGDIRLEMPSDGTLASLVSSGQPSDDAMQYLRRILGHQVDSSLDRYDYSVFGLSGSFVIKSDGTVVHLSGDGVAIEASRDGGGAIESFSLIGPDGTRYVLDLAEKGTHDGTFSQSSYVTEGAPDRWEATTSWLLTSVTSRSGLETARFSYGDAMTWRRSLASRSSALCCTRSASREEHSVSCEDSYWVSTSEVRPLACVTLSGFTASFTYATDTGSNLHYTAPGHSRQNCPFRLTGVRVTNCTGRELLDVSVGTTREPNDGRIVLSTLQIGRGGSLDDRWSFTYRTMPHRVSRYSQDWYGFYNGEDDHEDPCTDSCRHLDSLCPFEIAQASGSYSISLAHGRPDASLASYMSMLSADHDGARTDFSYEGSTVPVGAHEEVSVGIRLSSITVSDNGTVRSRRKFTYEEPFHDCPVQPTRDMYGVTKASQVLSVSGGTQMTDAYRWILSIHETPVSIGPSIRDARVLYGKVTEDRIPVMAVPDRPLDRTEVDVQQNLGNVGDLVVNPGHPIRQRILSRTVRYYQTGCVRVGATSTIGRFPEGWRRDAYESIGDVPGCFDPMDGVRSGYFDDGPVQQPLLTRVEEYSCSDGYTPVLVSSTEYTYDQLSRESVLTGYVASLVMERPLAGNVGADDVYHFPVYTCSAPGSVAVSERHVEHLDSGTGERSVSYAHVGCDDISVPVRLSRVETSVGGFTRTLSYTYPDEGGRLAQDWMRALASQHALSMPVAKTLSVSRTGWATARRSEETVYGGFTIGGSQVLLPARHVEKVDGVESWNEEVLSRDVHGNVSSFKSTGRPVTSVLWSWHGLHPAAVVENAGIDAVTTAVRGAGFVSTLADSDSINYLQGNNLGRLRTHGSLDGARVTTYDFVPGIGLTGETGPSGRKQKYGYDHAGRLSSVSDADGNAYVEYEYSLLNSGDGRLSMRTRTYRDEAGSLFSEDVRWWDTLGLVTQETALLGSGSGDDLVTVHVHDAFMHDDAKVWLPYPAWSTSGAFQQDAVAAAAEYHGSSEAYHSRTYEKSQRDRLTSSALPGLAGSHETTYGAYDGSASMRVYVWTADGIADAGSYGAGEVTMETTEYEEGGRTFIAATYKDRTGRVLGTSKVPGETTLYIYDLHDRLRAVAGPGTALTDTLNMWRFGYDSRGRLISKGVPGAVRESYGYDDEDRPVFMSRNGVTTVAAYDDFGEAVTRTVNSDQGTVACEFRTYDTYPSEAAPLIHAATGSSSWNGPSKGLLTTCSLSEIGQEGTAGGSALTVYLYDSRERPVWTVTRYPDGSILKVGCTYGFSGEVLSRQSTLVRDGSEDVLEETMSYDVRGRVTDASSSLTHCGGDAVTAATSYGYDDLGRPCERTSWNGDAMVSQWEDYTLQGWLASHEAYSESQPIFCEELCYENPSVPGVHALHNGLVTQKTEQWMIPGRGMASSTVGYTYDGAGRLTAVRTSVGEREGYTYDSRGNVTSATSFGSSMTMSYSGDRITGVSGSGVQAGFGYDALGRMTFDGLSARSIEYNHMDLPAKVTFGGTTEADYCYLADGTKTGALKPSGEGLVYRGPFVYRRGSDGALSLEGAACREGMLTASDAFLYVTDHLGSVRAVVMGSDGSVVEASDFSAYGERTALLDASVPGVTFRGRFTGKEDQSADFDIPYTDFGARHYSPQLRRWLVPDPMGEKYFGTSPYAFCDGNPVSLVDVDGAKIQVLDSANGSKSYTYNLDAKKFIDAGGNAYSGTYAFILTVTNQLNTLCEGETGKALVSELVKSEQVVLILPGHQNGEAKNTSPLFESVVSGVRYMGSSALNSGTEYTALGHELAHSLDRIRGTLDKGIWFKTEDEDVRFAELFSTFIENKIRKEHGLELRTRYLDGGLIDGVDDSVVDAEGRSLYYDVNQNTRKNYRIVKKDQRYVF